MSTRSHQPPHLLNEFGEPLHESDPPPPPGRCQGASSFVKGVCGFLLSHVGLLTLVVGYCMAGAVIFEKLEKEHEEEVKQRMITERVKVTDDLWDITSSVEVLIEADWTENVTTRLKDFEHLLLKAMKEQGWDGVEGGEAVNWTFTGSLFYAITVITTIGYGHIAPKTAAAKIVTIFYAILGIPLTVLCWSNIGDAMANAFRFTYWRICCYLCTRKPRQRRRRHFSRHSRAFSSTRSSNNNNLSPGGPNSGAPPSRWSLMRRSQRMTSVRSDEDAIVKSDVASYNFDGEGDNCNGSTSRYYDDSEGMMGNHHGGVHSVGHSPVGSFIKPKKDLESEQQQQQETNNNSNRALDSSAESKTAQPEKKASAASRMVRGLGLKRGGDRESQKSQKSTTSAASASIAPSEEEENNSSSFPLQQNRPSSFRHMSPPPHLRLHRVPEDHDWVAPPPPHSAPAAGPAPHFYYDDYLSDDDLADDYSRRNVPIWLSLLLVVAYIVWGAFIFQEWEDWKLLDSGYFCFITLTTIGFGDLVPNQQTPDGEIRIALCSLYLLFGIAMIAMSFNLVQEQVISNVKELGRQLGIIKDEDEEDDY